MYCGISSTIWGFLFGGFFGDMLSVLSNGSIVMPAIWFNPMDNPTLLMIWSIVFGVIHLFAGMFASALNMIRAGRWQDAVFDILPWYLIIIGIGLLLLPPVAIVGEIMAIAGVAIILLFAGRPAKNPITRLFKGIGALYNITAYLSDILSYTRILALVLATSVIAMVVNLMGFMMGPSIPGIIVFIIVALAGHGLNLALSALSAYVHTSRLHYVEFFGKFYAGGGRMWKPLKLKTRYTEISRVLPEASQSIAKG
jgi:V/A-type H+-transporting ATPase subunit I